MKVRDGSAEWQRIQSSLVWAWQECLLTRLSSVAGEILPLGLVSQRPGNTGSHDAVAMSQ